MLDRQDKYAWTLPRGLDLMRGTEPKSIFPEAKTIIVLVNNYFQEAFPPSMSGKFGRCYMNDDRMIKDDLYQRIKSFRNFLREDGIDSKIGNDLPQRLTAARAGLGTFGKNNFFYSRRAGRQSSWMIIVSCLIDRELAPDTPTVGVACPKWCKNTCIVSCPTGAITGPNKIDPGKCISYLSYYEYREAMGMKVYGCDRCQDVCPRNEAWLAQELPLSAKVAAWADDFDLPKLLHMDVEYYLSKVQPRMFYMPAEELWRFQMNVARAMGNSLDPKYMGDLARCLEENSDERVREMAAWSLEKLSQI